VLIRFLLCGILLGVLRQILIGLNILWIIIMGHIIFVIEYSDLLAGLARQHYGGRDKTRNGDK